MESGNDDSFDSSFLDASKIDILSLLNEEKIESFRRNVIVEDILSNEKFQGRTPPSDAGAQKHTDHDDPESIYQMVHDDIRRAEKSYNSEGSMEIDLIDRSILRTPNVSDDENDYYDIHENVPGIPNSEVFLKSTIAYKISPNADMPTYAPKKPGRRGLFKYYSSNDSSLEELLKLTPEVVRRISFGDSPKTPESIISAPETPIHAPKKKKKVTSFPSRRRLGF